MDWEGMTFRTRAQERREASRVRPDRGKRGDTMLWCEHCKRFVTIPRRNEEQLAALGYMPGDRVDPKDELDYDGMCPSCESPLFKMKCTRCGNAWYPRDPTAIPGTCPRCKSPYYNRSRVRPEQKARPISIPAETAAKIIERAEADP